VESREHLRGFVGQQKANRILAEGKLRAVKRVTKPKLLAPYLRAPEIGIGWDALAVVTELEASTTS
jgi:hypothetical protein